MSNSLDLRPLFRIRIVHADGQLVIGSDALIELPEWLLDLDVRWKDGIRLEEEREISFSVDPTNPDVVSVIAIIQGKVCDEQIVIVELQDDNSWQEVINAPLSGFDYKDGRLEFICRSGDFIRTEKLMCRDLSLLSSNPGYSRTIWLPVVFGDGVDVDCVPLFIADGTRTQSEVNADDTEIALTKIPDQWPESGRVQINDEIIRYGALQRRPSVLLDLERDDPRDHPSRTTVRLLPENGLEWIVCDHHGIITALYSGEGDGDELSQYLFLHEIMDGQTATVVQRDLFPVALDYETFTVVQEITDSSSRWDILPDTVCLTPRDAFAQNLPVNRGAILSLNGPVLNARMTRDLSREAGRFDRPEKLELAFRINSNGLWGRTQKLFVFATWKGQTVSATVRGDNVIQPNLKINREIRNAPQTLLQPETLPINSDHQFHDLDINEQWVDPLNMLNRFDASLTCIGVTSENQSQATTRFRFTHNLSSSGGKVQEFRFLIRGRSKDPGQRFRMEARIPGVMDIDEVFSLSEELETSELVIDKSDFDPSLLLEEGTVFRLTLMDEGECEFASSWIELTESVALPVTERDEAGFQLIEEVTVTELPSDLTLDLTDLLPTENFWQILDGSDDAVELRFLLSSNEPAFQVVVRDVHFRADTRPAKNVRTTTELRADIQGLVREDDGLCNPADVVKTLVSEPAFMNRGDVFDEAALAAFRESSLQSGIRFGGVFRNRIRLDAALRDALGESTGWIRSVEGSDGAEWRLIHLESEPDSGSVTMIPADMIINRPVEASIRKPDLCPSMLVFRDQMTRDKITMEPLNPDGSEDIFWPVLWTKKGTEYLASVVRGLFEGLEERTDFTMTPSPFAYWPGEFVSLPTELTQCLPVMKDQDLFDGDTTRAGLLLRQNMRDGVIHQSVRLLAEEVVLWNEGPASISARRFPAELRFVVAGKIVARFDDRLRLHLGGIVREGILSGSGSTGSEWNESDRAIVLRASSGTEHRVIRFTEDGDFETSDSISAVESELFPAGLNILDNRLTLATLSGRGLFNLDPELERIPVLATIIENSL